MRKRSTIDELEDEALVRLLFEVDDVKFLLSERKNDSMRQRRAEFKVRHTISSSSGSSSSSC